MAGEKVDKKVPIEENGTKEENGTSEPSISNENDESSEISSTIQKDGDEGKGNQ